uniref:Mitotic spindle assembly checkpoint protein MAD2B n=1 Tax=Ursus maritimus TaxID=29073 RepID=A0A452VDN7_URSMA
MTTLTRQDLNFGQVVADVLCEFLEVAVHLILYVREVYPVGIFQKRKKYNVPVQMSCHPELNQYIQDTLHCVKPLLEKNDVEKVVVVILDKEHRPVEKFVFEITQPPLLSISSDSLLSHVEQLLRAFILKISVCDAVLDHNPPGCTFTVLVHTREAATRNMEKIQVIKVRGDWSGKVGRETQLETLKTRCHSCEWAGVSPTVRSLRCLRQRLASSGFFLCVNCVATRLSWPHLGTQHGDEGGAVCWGCQLSGSAQGPGGGFAHQSQNRCLGLVRSLGFSAQLASVDLASLGDEPGCLSCWEFPRDSAPP